MTINGDNFIHPDDVEPFSVGRRVYFQRLLAASIERRQNAEAQVAILEDNLVLQEQRLYDIRQLLHKNMDDGARDQLNRAHGKLVIHVADIRSELERQRSLRTVTHHDHLVAWELEHGDRPTPQPGEYLLARRSRRPFGRRETA